MAYYSCNYAGCHGCVRGLWLLVAILITALPNSDGASDCFAPGGTRLISYDTPVFCQSLKMEDRSSKYPATLYLLRDRPQLTGRDEFEVPYSFKTINGTDYVYFKYYLYSGSNFTLRYCLYESTQPADFYIIRNESNFRSWVRSRNLKYAIHYTNISITCNAARSDSETTYYNISSAEQYYFVYYNPSASESLQVKTTMSFQRTLYDMTSSEIVKHCEADPGSTGTNRSTCSVDVSLDSHYSTLIVAGTVPQGTDYTDTVNIAWHCGGPRVWLYAVTICIPLVVAVTCLVAITIVCCYVWSKRKGKNKYQPLVAINDRLRPYSFHHPLKSEQTDTKTGEQPHRRGYGTIPDAEEAASDNTDIGSAKPHHQEPLDS